MDNFSNNNLQQFKNLVGLRFQLYNSLFTSLPFHRIEKTGVLLSLFLIHCEEGFRKKLSPLEIVESFLNQYTSYRKEQEMIDVLFRFVQYAERQVVLFDALEDAAFKTVNDFNGAGTLKQLKAETERIKDAGEITDKLNNFAVRLVLTAHPTQFYPGEVLGIINDLAKAVATDSTSLINMYLQQLAKTPFLNKTKPTPYDEAISLLWYLENVFYPAAGKIMMILKNDYASIAHIKHPLIQMGFWPGGDRDGNPYVTADITIKVAEALRGAIIKCYYLDVRRLKRRLTFVHVEDKLAELEIKLYNNLFIPDKKTDLSQEEILSTLAGIRKTLIEEHNGLFLHLLDNFICKVEIFGLHFASLDVRQESSIHSKLFDAVAEKSDILPAGYSQYSNDEKIKALELLQPAKVTLETDDAVLNDTLKSVEAIQQIQQYNGVAGCHRYIISQCNSALNVMEVFALFRMTGLQKPAIDIIPLFETVDDLTNAAGIMKQLYENKTYSTHIQQRANKQYIMLGFSDGTKDGGYLMANWGIYKAKKELTAISKKYNIDVVFFDGRGGPPARGGGKTHKFYASMGSDIANNEIQLTIQGQTISSNFGTTDAAQYNIEQLLHAGISNNIFSKQEVTLTHEESDLLQQLADESYTAYLKLKDHPVFTEYLAQVSPLRFYAETNIGSRPSKRGAASRLALKDLRAIPYVGALSQLKQNISGYYGVGTALQAIEKAGKWGSAKQLYDHSLFFKTLMDNCEMAMKKCFFPLTGYLASHSRYGELWNMMYDEFELTQKYVLKLSGNSELMADYPVEQLSVNMRERIVLPLVTIQQYALTRARKFEDELVQNTMKDTYGKLAMRCSFGIINAGRNSA